MINMATDMLSHSPLPLILVTRAPPLSVLSLQYADRDLRPPTRRLRPPRKQSQQMRHKKKSQMAISTYRGEEDMSVQARSEERMREGDVRQRYR
jgi:hypothetical protein